MKNIVVLISGRGSNFEAILRASREENWEADGLRIAAVISNRPEALGLVKAREAGIETVALDHKAYPTREAFEEKLAEAVDRYDPAVIVLAVTGGDKAQLCAGVTKDLIGKIKAGELVNFVAAQCGGKGGGKPDMAMAGASDVKALPAALESARAWIAEKLA